MAENSLRQDSLPQRALQYLKIIVRRYNRNPRDPEACRNGVAAMCDIGNIYMSYAIDYRMAYKYLTRARRIAQQNRNYEGLAYVYLSLSNLYSVNATNENSTRMEPLTIESLNKGMEAALASGNGDAIAAIANNMLFASFYDDKMRTACAGSLDKFRHYKFKKHAAREMVSRKLLDGIDAYWKGNEAKAVHLIKQACSLIKDEPFSERTVYSIDMLLINIYEKSKQYGEAIKIARKDLGIAHDNGHEDFELTMDKILANLYKAIGQTDSFEKYDYQYLRLRMEQEQSNSLHSVESLNFLSEIGKLKPKIEQMSMQSEKDKQLRTVILSALAILTCVLLSLLYVHLKLKGNHKRLFQESQKALKRDEQFELVRVQLENEINRLEKENESLRSPIATEARIEEGNSTQPPASPLEETDIAETYSRILQYMESSILIYNSGFSLAALAKNTGMPVKKASHAINARCGCNFHQFLNEYRIRKACQIMSMPENKDYTIEYFAESVGFKSRTSFASLFKKSIGLTPSEYIKMARESS